MTERIADDFAAGRAPAEALTPLGWVVVTFLLFWVTLLGHEAAHFVVGRLLYSPADLASGRLPRAAHLASVAAGPVFTTLVIIAGALAGRRLRDPRARAAIAAMVIGAASRAILVAPGTLLGHAINDETTAGRLAGIAPTLLWTAEAVLIAAAAVASTRLIEPEMRTRALCLIALGIVLGWVSALTFGRAIGLPI